MNIKELEAYCSKKQPDYMEQLIINKDVILKENRIRTQTELAKILNTNQTKLSTILQLLSALHRLEFINSRSNAQ